MAELYDRELSAPLMDAYWLAMRDWTMQDFEAAASQLMRTNKFMPRPADFNELRSATKPNAADAWFTKGVSQDHVANRAMKIATQGRYVGHIPLDELQWVQKKFIEVYEQIQDSAEAQKALPSQGIALEFKQKVAGLLSDIPR